VLLLTFNFKPSNAMLAAEIIAIKPRKPENKKQSNTRNTRISKFIFFKLISCTFNKTIFPRNFVRIAAIPIVVKVTAIIKSKWLSLK